MIFCPFMDIFNEIKNPFWIFLKYKTRNKYKTGISKLRLHSTDSFLQYEQNERCKISYRFGKIINELFVFVQKRQM